MEAQLKHSEDALALALAQCADLQGVNAQLNSEFKDFEALGREVLILRDSAKRHASQLKAEKAEKADLKRALATSKTDLTQALTRIEKLSTSERDLQEGVAAASERCSRAEKEAEKSRGEADVMQQVVQLGCNGF